MGQNGTDDLLDHAVFSHGNSVEDVLFRLCVVAREYVTTLAELPETVYALWCPELGMVLDVGTDQLGYESIAEQLTNQKLPLPDGKTARFIATPIPTGDLMDNENLAEAVPKRLVHLNGDTAAEKEAEATSYVRALTDATFPDDVVIPQVMYVVWSPQAGELHGMHADFDDAQFAVEVLNRRGYLGDDDKPIEFTILPVDTSGTDAGGPVTEPN